MSYELEGECPVCDSPAWLRYGWNEPDPAVGYVGGPYLMDMECEEGHTDADLTGPELRDLEERAQGRVRDEQEARRDEYMERRMDAERLGLG